MTTGSRAVMDTDAVGARGDRGHGRAAPRRLNDGQPLDALLLEMRIERLRPDRR